MKIEQAQAVINYLEFLLNAFVEETAQYIEDPDVKCDMYERANGLLIDMESTLDMQVMLEYKSPLTSDRNN